MAVIRIVIGQIFFIKSYFEDYYYDERRFAEQTFCCWFVVYCFFCDQKLQYKKNKQILLCWARKSSIQIMYYCYSVYRWLFHYTNDKTTKVYLFCKTTKLWVKHQAACHSREHDWIYNFRRFQPWLEMVLVLQTRKFCINICVVECSLFTLTDYLVFHRVIFSNSYVCTLQGGGVSRLDQASGSSVLNADKKILISKSFTWCCVVIASVSNTRILFELEITCNLCYSVHISKVI